MKSSEFQNRLAFFLAGLLLLHLTGCSFLPWGQTKTEPRPGKLVWAGDLPVLHLYGTPYEMGHQHGSLLKVQVRASVRNAMQFIDTHVDLPVLGGWLARKTLDRAWAKMKPHVPRRYLEELRGLSDGAGIPMRTLERIHALPELTSTTCSSFAAFGSATEQGRLIQIRNLDWAIKSNVQEHAALLVYHPQDQKSFVSVGWLGFIGVISGISEEGISVAEIGAETVDISLDGVPMPFLLRQVLEESGNLQNAVRLVQDAPRTVGYNYLFADAQKRQAVAIETTRTHAAVFWQEQRSSSAYEVHVPNTLFRSDFALDRSIRELQLACKGHPGEPGLESPEDSSAYRVRYLGQGQLLMKFQGQIDPELAMVIAAAIAPSSNMQSVVYAYPELWFANAVGAVPAAEQSYRSVDLEELFSEVLEPL
jgi:hypothetical protein